MGEERRRAGHFAHLPIRGWWFLGGMGAAAVIVLVVAAVTVVAGQGGDESNAASGDETPTVAVTRTKTPTPLPATGTRAPSPPDSEATVELTGAMVDTEVTVAVYEDTARETAGTACVDLVELMVPAHAMEEAAWKPAACTFDLRTWNRVQFKEREGVWFMHTVAVLFGLAAEPPDRTTVGDPPCAEWADVLMAAEDNPSRALLIGNCAIQPPIRGFHPPGRQVWARIPTTVVDDPEPTAPCWTLAPLYGASGEGYTRDVLCVLTE